MIHQLDENCRNIEVNLSEFIRAYRPECFKEWRQYCETLEQLSVVERTKRLDDMATILLDMVYPQEALEKWERIEKHMKGSVSIETLELFYETLPEWYDEVEMEELV